MISNQPKIKRKLFYPWCYWDTAFNDDEMIKLCDYVKKFKLTSGKTIGSNQEELLNTEYRVSNVNFFTPDEENTWIFNKFNFVIQNINERYYNFDLIGYDAIQYSEYDKNGKYDFHVDTLMGKIIDNIDDTRKLSLVMLLNDPDKDFKGGNFEIKTAMSDTKIEMTKGKIILFPSFILHRVTPVTKGIRKSLVLWVTGPKFK
jgi:PKHD-type hydroxylase